MVRLIVIQKCFYDYSIVRYQAKDKYDFIFSQSLGLKKRTKQNSLHMERKIQNLVQILSSNTVFVSSNISTDLFPVAHSLYK